MKRLLSVLLALVMALGLLATTAWADETHSHCVCGTTGTVNGHTHDATIPTWTAWTETDSLPSGGGYYYLTQDVTLTSVTDVVNCWEVTNNTSLCLNGYTIKVNNSKIQDGILVNGATLNLTDCKGSGKITSLTPDVKGEKVVVVACWDKSVLNMYGGTITGINVKNDAYYSGGGVHNEGIFNMYGGTITGNTAKNGGGVGNWTNTNVTDSHITATFNFYGGTISGNTATDGESDAAYFDGGTVNIAGGTINGKIKVNGANTITGVIRGDVEISGLDNKYTVTFNTSGGSAVASQTLIGANAKAVKPADPTKEGYAFVGWVNDDGTPYNFELTVNNDLTLTAVWEEIPAPEGHTHTRRQPAATTTNTDTTVTDTTKADTVTSAKTFDMGVMVYGVMAAASVLGMGYVGKKRG